MVSLYITEYFVPIDTELLFNKLFIFCLAPFLSSFKSFVVAQYLVSRVGFVRFVSVLFCILSIIIIGTGWGLYS